MTSSTNDTRDQNFSTHSWPFEEAKKLLERVKDRDPSKPVLFETGYGPSGLPHIGTFGEVARTTWVRQAFEKLTGRPTRLIAFSDDMDALRKVPTNVPNQEMLSKHLGQPLSRIPDPFGTDESFAAHNNNQLQNFLNQFSFDFDFVSSSSYYESGKFNKALTRVLECHEQICKVVHPTLGAERRASYSPILPIHPETGEVMQVAVEITDPAKGLIKWKDANGKVFETCVFDGHAKLQWKADWAMRWYALGIDYEMSGKDLIDSVKLSSAICRILGGTPPVNLTYELFLDAEGQKISKSKGNGLSIEEWLRYGPTESLSYYMFQNPKRAKRLYFDMIPRSTDEYIGSAALAAEDYNKTPVEDEAQEKKRLARNDKIEIAREMTAFLSKDHAKHSNVPVSFGALLNLAAVANAPDKETLWRFIGRYDKSLTPQSQPYLDTLIGHAVDYAKERLEPLKKYRQPTDVERAALLDLKETLSGLDPSSTPDEVQTQVFEVGKRHFEKSQLRSWFGCLYEVLLGQEQGPRFGVFAALYGLSDTCDLIDQSLSR